MDENLKQFLMNCDIEDLSEETTDKYENIAKARQLSERYWRDRINAENQ
jgi:hypothetical protein